ncbi:BnaCnng61060D [Brassica napus]|uniref:BnaCnng61060D protein n=1 Tax=Brassica napus TaxID=3708 RepID=A0A078JTF7_BRANA|nr:BnaCnng61060D [Brassica napus]
MTSRFHPCVGRSKIKRVIKLRLFKTADVLNVFLFYAASVFYSAIVAVLTALIVMTVAGSAFSSGCSG